MSATANLFLQLKKYSGGIISQDENYATQALAVLLSEFPSFRALLVRDLFGIEIGPEASIRTQVPYETRRFGRAILDLVIEDVVNFIVVEVKVESGLNYYESREEIDRDSYDQIAKYEDCEGFPPDKSISVFVLSKYSLNLGDSSYKYFKPDSNQMLWKTLFERADNYYRSLGSETPEKYLLGKFLDYLKEEGMAGFQNFKVEHLADLSRRAKVDAVCENHRSLISDNITIPNFKARAQVAYNRDGIVYELVRDRDIKVFAGLWLSDEGYYFKFPAETGPQVMVFVELPPKHKLRSSLVSSEAYGRVSKEFGRQKDGWQILLRRRPLIEFLGSSDQGERLLDFYRKSIAELQESGLLAELTEGTQGA